MTRDGILAVVVSYNGATRLRETVAALRPQVGHLLVVDNGSEAPTLAILDELERSAGVAVTRLGRNTGIGHALNLGVQRARELGASWLLTMDQDSVAEAGMIPAYLAALAERPGLVSLTPSFTGARPESANAIEEVASAITSGNLVRVSLFDAVGLYDESFFIDSVDFDFSLRLRRAGHAIHRVPAAVLGHQLGEAREIPSLWRRYYSEHSPLRRYYISRNVLYMVERYLFRFPLFILKLAAAHLLELVLVGFFDPRPGESYQAALRGVGDFFRRRQGPYLERAR